MIPEQETKHIIIGYDSDTEIIRLMDGQRVTSEMVKKMIEKGQTIRAIVFGDGQLFDVILGPDGGLKLRFPSGKETEFGQIPASS